MTFRGFKLYRKFVGGKWAKFKNKWYPVKNFGPLLNFLDVDDGDGMVHYSHSEIQSREEYKLKHRTEKMIYGKKA
jgi:hypothetical protein